jgi:diadenylate cyclase
MIDSLLSWQTLAALAQIVLIAAMLWLFYRRLIRGTNAEKLVRGLVGLVVIWLASAVFSWLGLGILGGFAHWVALFLSIGLVVIFQPELRKFLGMLGKVSILSAVFAPKKFAAESSKEAAARNANEIAKACEYMSAKHIGALIVFRDNLDGTINNIGTIVNADISSELLLTIFFPKTSLHDGAVIIKDGRIYSAGAILPLTENKNLHWQYGTRHRAALGMSEQSNAAILVVSEETGNISLAVNGKLTKLDDIKKLRARLEKILLG